MAAWGAPRDGTSYLEAMRHGRRFFVAVSSVGRVIGFSDAGEGGLAVYVRGEAARQGIGSALLARAEGVLRSGGTKVVQIDASLNAEPFYAKHGYRSMGQDDHRLSTGLAMRCVRMEKPLAEVEIYSLSDEAATRALGASLAQRLAPGDLVRLEGPLGAGKTTLVRGLLEALGHKGPVRSPTFNLLQAFATDPPVLHADLYRVASAEGTGLEDYLDTHVVLVEWPDRLPEDAEHWLVEIAFEGEGRIATIQVPTIVSASVWPS